jgi:phenylpropionate dioxygenase-like ring-hydroxylating dioxygenase large terminal subunit
VAPYTDQEQFRMEREKLFEREPTITLHSSELPDPGSFVTTRIAGRTAVIVRGDDGVVRAFHNVCRHRGAELVDEDSGCRKRFSCPYHAWTWNNAGQLIAVPHEASGFPGLEREAFGLHRFACEEYSGWIWVSLSRDEPLDVRAHLGELDGDIRAMEAESHVIFESTRLDIAANWKLLVEGGIESYHFRVAHRDTIAPLFLDNLSSYQCFGRHLRSVLPRSNLPELRDKPREQWDIGRYANVLYTLFPGPQFLVQDDHFVWIQSTPVAPGRTELRLATVIPRESHTLERESYWRKNHALTLYTLKEDFELAQGIQRGFACGGNEFLNFGRFEGALQRFSQFVADALAE